MSAQTLDGMTVEQLRDLAKRAEAAAKAQEDGKAKTDLVTFGEYTYDKTQDRILVSSTQKWVSRFNNDTFNRAIRDALNGQGVGDLTNMVRFLKILVESKGYTV